MYLTEKKPVLFGLEGFVRSHIETNLTRYGGGQNGYDVKYSLAI